MAGAGKRRFNRTEKPRAGKKELAKWEAIKERGNGHHLRRDRTKKLLIELMNWDELIAGQKKKSAVPGKSRR